MVCGGEGGGLQENLLQARVAHRTQDANSKNDNSFPLFQRSIKRARKGGVTLPKNPFYLQKEIHPTPRPPIPSRAPLAAPRGHQGGRPWDPPWAFRWCKPPDPLPSHQQEERGFGNPGVEYLMAARMVTVTCLATSATTIDLGRPRATWVDQDRRRSTKIDKLE